MNQDTYTSEFFKAKYAWNYYGTTFTMDSWPSDQVKVLSGPDIVTRGFVYVRESEHLLEECRMVIWDTMEKIGEKGITDWGRIKNAIRDALGEFLWQRTKRSPMILPVLSEVE